MTLSKVGVLLLLTIISYSAVGAQNDIVRVNSEYDESSCICGLSKEILDGLETILRQTPAQCSSPSTPAPVTTPPPTNSSIIPTSLQQLPLSDETDNGGANTAGESEGASEKNTESDGQATQLLGVLEQMAGKMTKLSEGFERIEYLLAKLVVKPSDVQSVDVSTPMNSSSTESNQTAAKPIQSDRENDGAFLIGLKPLAQTNAALMMLNQSSTVDPQTMQTALQSTVPNVVSNIFTNIDNLQQQLQQQPHASKPSGNLTSVDGSSSIEFPTTNSTAIMMSTGEKLLLLWVEKQLESLHVTASVANHLRKTALSLFRRIMNEYIDRMSKLGSNLTQNMRTVTQIALNNTQNLIAFILKNYMNFAGGFMQIIGERVSSVGRQLDTAGGIIAHIPTNPLDIVSSVMDSLPNPANYSKYFRAFGKQLFGDEGPSNTKLASQAIPSDPVEPATGATKEAGIFSKTMGALSKTFGFLG